MARIVILGSGFAGQTAAFYLRKYIGKRNHEVVMVTPAEYFTYQPSLVWVGVDRMKVHQATFPLEPVYRKFNITYKRAYAREIHPETQKVVIEFVGGGREEISYDYLVNATGPHLAFEETPGMGPEHGTTHSICTASHAEETRKAYLQIVERLKQGDRVKIVIGVGHPTATCQGAAVEYITNVHADLVRRGLRHNAEITWLSNEPELGDLGVGGLVFRRGDKIVTSRDVSEALYAEFGIKTQIQTAVTRVEPGKIYWENARGEQGVLPYDFAMLLPPFKGARIAYVGRDGSDLTKELTNPAGFLKVDGRYGKKWEELTEDDWPKLYQNPTFPNIFAAGIAFAPPGAVSKPLYTPSGRLIQPTVPRTGMTASLIGMAVAKNLVDLLHGRPASHEEPMTEMPGSCVASMDASFFRGEASTILMYPVVPNYKLYPEFGRDPDITRMELGLAGAWIKRILHTTFLYKMKGLPGWSYIPG